MTVLWKLRSAIAGLVGAHMPRSSKASTGVTVMLKAKHRSRVGDVHSHEWEITAIWPEGRDALSLRTCLTKWLSQYEGKCLPDRIAWGEDLAREIINTLECDRVEVRRRAEGIYAEASR